MSQDPVSNPTREESRLRAKRRVDDLLALLQKAPGLEGAADLVIEAEGLSRAIDAFHMEGIRFRMYSLDRRLQRVAGSLPEAHEIFADVRASLETAGFHTRSH
jgi:hypothetical protein